MKEFKYKINGSPYRVIVQDAEDGVVELEVNGTPYKVELEEKKKKTMSSIKRKAPSTNAPSNAPIPSVKPATSPSAGSNVINSPLPGVVLELRVNVGDTVKKGDTLLVLEAMKMENNIQATSDGKVTQVSVNQGDSVLEGAELVVIE